MSSDEVFSAERAEDNDITLGLATLLPPGPVLVTSVDAETWAEKNGLSKGAEIVAIGPKHVKVSALTTKAFLEAVRDRPLDLDIRLADSKSVEEVESLMSQGCKDVRWPPARPIYPFILGDNVDMNASRTQEQTDLTLAIVKNTNMKHRIGLEQRRTLESPTSKLEAKSIDSIEDALRAAHQHALAEAKRYWRCEMAISETRMRCYMARVETSEMRDQLVSEPREAAAELRQASEMREEALVVAKQVGDSEMKLSELHLEVAARTSDARHVARHFTKKQQSLEDVRGLTQKHSNMAKSDRQLADFRQQEALVESRKAEPVFETLSHVEAEARQMRYLLKTEQADCDKQFELKGRLQREIRDLRNHGPPGQNIKSERDVLLRELRELNKMARDRPNNAEVSGRPSLLRPSTPPPLVKRATLAATLATKREGLGRSGEPPSDAISRSVVESPRSSHASLNMSPTQGFEGSDTTSNRKPTNQDYDERSEPQESIYSGTPSDIASDANYGDHY